MRFETQQRSIHIQLPLEQCHSIVESLDRINPLLQMLTQRKIFTPMTEVIIDHRRRQSIVDTDLLAEVISNIALPTLRRSQQIHARALLRIHHVARRRYDIPIDRVRLVDHHLPRVECVISSEHRELHARTAKQTPMRQRPEVRCDLVGAGDQRQLFAYR